MSEKFSKVHWQIFWSEIRPQIPSLKAAFKYLVVLIITFVFGMFVFGATWALDELRSIIAAVSALVLTSIIFWTLKWFGSFYLAFQNQFEKLESATAKTEKLNFESNRLFLVVSDKIKEVNQELELFRKEKVDVLKKVNDELKLFCHEKNHVLQNAQTELQEVERQFKSARHQIAVMGQNAQLILEQVTKK